MCSGNNLSLLLQLVLLVLLVTASIMEAATPSHHLLAKRHQHPDRQVELGISTQTLMFRIHSRLRGLPRL